MAEQRSYTGGFDNRWLFTGKELDESTGLYYFGARFYNPSTSIWLSVDPLVEKTMDAYGYCYQNPVRYIDPDGRLPIVPILWWAGKRIAAGAIADITVQLASEWIRGGGSLGDAWERLDIDGWQVVRSAGENLVSGKYSAAALSAAGDMIAYMMSNEDWTWEGALLAAGEGAISALLGDQLARSFTKKLNLSAGGAHGKFDNQYDDLGNLLTNKNHLPTVQSYRLAGFKISDYMGSAHIITISDHKKFISTGAGRTARAFRKAEAELLKAGRFMDAFDLNVNAIRRQFGNKYDKAMEQARKHFEQNVVPRLQNQLNN